MSNNPIDTKDKINKSLTTINSENRKYRRFLAEKTKPKEAELFISIKKYLALMPNQKLIPILASAAGIDAVLKSMSNAQNPHWLRLYQGNRIKQQLEYSIISAYIHRHMRPTVVDS